MATAPVKPRTGTSYNDIDAVVWLAFLTSIERVEDGQRYLNGYPITETMSRGLYRWRHEGTTPTLFVVDRYLVAIGLHLDEFFDWATERGLDPWLHGEPEWHRAAPDWDEIDKTWTDPPVEDEKRPTVQS